MSDKPWPQDVVDALNDHGVESPTCCGETRTEIAFKAVGGCEQPLSDPSDRYKCADCKVTFHRACIREHFRRSGDTTEILRDRIMKALDACERAKSGITVDTVLGWLFREVSK